MEKKTAKVNKLCLKCAIKVSHKIARVLLFGLQRTESGGRGGVRKPKEEAHSVWTS